jgi:parallel beta-helix repeat protein
LFKKIFLITCFVFFLTFTFFNGCIEEETGNIEIQGKGYFDSIQEAINAASNNDKILVYNGIYNETLTINKSISLISVDRNPTIIQYIGHLPDISVIEINGDNCTIDGFQLFSNNKSLRPNGIKINSNNNLISNNTINDFYNGLYLDNANNNLISYNTIQNNDNGLFTVLSINNNILSNNFTKNKVYGVYIASQSNDNLFKYNDIYENDVGLRIKGSRLNKFENNIVENNDDKGFYFCCGALDNTVFNNSIIDNNPNADDHYNNQWHYNNVGNYWGDYLIKYSDAIDENDDGFWDIPYLIYENTTDMFPLIKPIKI